jgi:hypothetical protein
LIARVEIRPCCRCPAWTLVEEYWIAVGGLHPRICRYEYRKAN